MPKLLKRPDDLDGNLRALLNAPPPPAGTPGSRKVAPKPTPKPTVKQRRRVPRTATSTYEYESALVLKGKKPATLNDKVASNARRKAKWKAAKKR